MDEKEFDFSEFLECTPYVNFNAETVKVKSDELKALDKEILAFEVRPKYGEVDYHDNNERPSEKLMEVLKTSNDALEMYLHNLPEDLYED